MMQRGEQGDVGTCRPQNAVGLLSHGYRYNRPLRGLSAGEFY